MYHRFGETKYPSTNITVEQLESHLNYLVEQNYRFIQAGDLLDPEQQKEKTITVTIDDAYLSFYEVGLPIFEKYQVPVTLFLNTENVGGFNYRLYYLPPFWYMGNISLDSSNKQCHHHLRTCANSNQASNQQL